MFELILQRAHSEPQLLGISEQLAAVQGALCQPREPRGARPQGLARCWGAAGAPVLGAGRGAGREEIRGAAGGRAGCSAVPTGLGREGGRAADGWGWTLLSCHCI